MPGMLRHASIKTTGDVYVQTMEQSVLAAVNLRTSTVLGDWKMPEKRLGLKGRKLEGLNETRRSRSNGVLQVLERLAPQVGLEPTTLRLTARTLLNSGLLRVALYSSFSTCLLLIRLGSGLWGLTTITHDS